ncbi:MAG: N-acetyltransferase [Myxococcales bacterium]|nr:N-acetyltransferase [Myxococcales bacterium]
MKPQIHPTAEVETGTHIGEGTQIWHWAHVRTGATVGAHCRIGRGVYVDAGVTVGSHVKIQNYVSVYQGVTLGDGVFVGPHVVFTNDRRPRAIAPDGTPLGPEDWTLEETVVEQGASLGARSVVLCGITLGRWCMVGAGAVVTRNVPPFALVLGHPARPVAVVDRRGEVIARPYAPGTYASSDGGPAVVIEPDWVP